MRDADRRLGAGRRRLARGAASSQSRGSATTCAQVAVTEGDKVEAQIRFGVAVNGLRRRRPRECGRTRSPTPRSTGSSPSTRTAYELAPRAARGGERRESLRDAARIEAGLRAFLERRRFRGVHRHLRGLARPRSSCPASPSQRLMADGYGFGAEGDWKTAALVRIVKVMSAGLAGGTSFMEDYTYHLAPGRTRRCSARTCSRSARRSPRRRPSCEIHPLVIGGKAGSGAARLRRRRPARRSSSACVDLGDRFRLVANEVERRRARHDLPRLPVARAVWKPRPDFATAAEALARRRRAAPHASSPRRSAARRSPTSPRSPGSSCSSSTTRPGSATSRTSCAGTRRTTGSPRALVAARRAARRVLEANLAIVAPGSSR